MAVLVGGVGVANTMVISVLERRAEIGLRRALGATRRHVGAQFLTESVVLSVLGGTAGIVLGTLAAAGYAVAARESVAIPAAAVGGGIAIAIAAGLAAGAYPAVRAARLEPAAALRAT